MKPQIKTVYVIVSLYAGTPVYRVYNIEQARAILYKCWERYPDKHFWMEKKIVTLKPNCI